MTKKEETEVAMGEGAQADLPRRFRHAPESSIFASATTSAFLKLYALTAPLLFAIDLAWLGLVARDRALVFAMLPGLERGSLPRAAALGASLGCICYCTYDLTNLALAMGFPTSVAVVDIVWGTILGAGVSAAAFKLAGLVM